MIQKLPSLDVEDFECITDFMLEFYRHLGWDPTKQELDPRKIAIHPDTWKEICMQVKRRWGIELSPYNCVKLVSPWNKRSHFLCPSVRMKLQP